MKRKTVENWRVDAATACGDSFQAASGSLPSQAALMILSMAYLLWLEAVSKDWLLSYVEPYPFMASLATTGAVLGGFVALRLGQATISWFGRIACVALTLAVTDLLRIIPRELGTYPAVPVLCIALGTASLFAGNRLPANGNEKPYGAAAVAAGTISLCVGGARAKKLLWTVLLLLVVTAISGLAVWLAKRGRTSGVEPKVWRVLTRFCAALIVAGFGIPVGLAFGPSLSLGISDAAMLGLGLEWQHRSNLSSGSFVKSLALLVVLTVGALLWKCWLRLRVDRQGPFMAVSFLSVGGPVVIGLLTRLEGGEYGLLSAPQLISSNAFGRTLATEYGLLTVLVVGLMLWTAVVTGVVKLLAVRPHGDGEAQGVSLVLCAGSISALFGLLLSSRLGPPFMTSDSMMGTATLATVVASVGGRSSLGKTSFGRGFWRSLTAGDRRKTLVLLGGALTASLLLIFFLGLSYRRKVEQIIRPYMDGKKTPSFSSGFVPLSEISTIMQDAIIACEDPGFFNHRGFEWRALHGAVRLDLREARIIRGSSTITQQLAKNLFLTKERTLSRKIKEAVVTFELERLLSKERILELYLNVIEYGSDQRGILAAAGYYFHESPKELSLAESALLAGLVSQTSRSSSLYALGVGQRRALILMRLKWKDRYNEANFETASAIPLHTLLRATIREPSDKGDEANQQVPASAQNKVSAVQTWQNIGLLIGLGIFSGCAATAALFVQALRVTKGSNESSVRPRMRKVLLAAGTCSLFAMFGLHWYEINRERSLTTVLYPYRHSPNYDQRPPGSRVTSVVLHSSEQPTMGAAINFSQDPNTKASPHFVVGDDGRIFQLVPVERRAWHAGNSQLENEANVNNFSVGVALVHQSKAKDSYSDLQYEGVARIIHELRQDYRIPDERIVSHSQIARPAGSVNAEGFDLDKLQRIVHSISETQPIN